MSLLCDTPERALAFVSEHGIVLVSAKGSVPRLTEAIIGEPIKGSWWGHPQSHHIFKILESITSSDQILVCRLIKGKVTLIHRRLWPSLVRIAPRFTPQQIAQLREEHSVSGRHITHEIPFPVWVPESILSEAETVDEATVHAVFSDYLL